VSDRALSSPRPRLRDLGIPVGRFSTGPLNALTDVPGVRVGHTTLVEGQGPLVVGQGPIRTGVTAIHPHEGSAFSQLVPAAVEVLNGAGELTGRSQIEEFGTIESPIVLTNTLSVGAAHQALTDWLVAREPGLGTDHFVVPVVAETFDGFVNDIAGQHVRREHVWAALDGATAGPVAEGSVGGGTGMTLFGYKGGIGTASRRVEVGGQSYTLGVLVQGNFGEPGQLLCNGLPVGAALEAVEPPRGRWRQSDTREGGSVIVVVATDAPLSDRQCRRLCKRAMLGIGRVGGNAGHSSGDLLLAFSNHPANRVDRRSHPPLVHQVRLADDLLNDLFAATAEATVEAVLNALVASDTMVGRDGNRIPGLPVVALVDAVGRAGLLLEPAPLQAR
jgi:D-aminopeptidase